MAVSLIELVHCACLLEAEAPKAGNVHPQAALGPLTFRDFTLSADAIGPILGDPMDRSVGELIFEAARATRAVVSTNTNLGIILLLAPLVRAASNLSERHLAPLSLQAALAIVLRELTVADSVLTYRAIRLAEPGGLGTTDQQDLANEPTVTLRDAMALAADHDAIARQYVTQYADVFGLGVRTLRNLTRVHELESAIVITHLTLIAELGDSLIRRKFGSALDTVVRERARTVLLAWETQQQKAPLLPITQLPEFRQFDCWLRSPIHQSLAGPVRHVNPGTTADLIAASLFVYLATGD